MKKLLFSAILACSVAPAFATSWMAQLPDAMPMRRISLPGAHDAAAKNLSTGKTQDLDIAALWDAGVRAFDLRPNNNLTLYHGAASTGVTMEQAFSAIEGKLAVDKNDFAFLLIKMEQANDAWPTTMANFLKQHDANIVQYSPNMTLGQARGKIVVVTRDAIGGYTKAGYSGNWNDNQAWKEAYMEGKGVRETMRLQDNYDFNNDLSAKATAITNMLDYSCGFNDEAMWAVNFTSGYKKNILGIGDNGGITDNAKASNKVALDYLNDPRKPQGRTGIVFMDYAGVENGYYGKQLVDAIIARNSKPIQFGALAREKGNWTAGPAAKSVGTTSYSNSPKGDNAVTVIESYREDAFTTGNVMSFKTTGMPNGEYIVDIMAQACWTPNRGSIKTAACTDGAYGCTQLVINDNTVDLPVRHNAGWQAPLDCYAVPCKVTDGTLSIKIDNIKEGANWHSVYVAGIYNKAANGIVYSHTFDGNFFGWQSTTGADNQCIKWGGGDSPFATASYENWKGSAYTGKLFARHNVLNGRYRVELDIKVDATDNSKVYFFANDSKTPITNTNVNSYSTEIQVTDHTLEFGLGMDAAVAKWVLIDNPRVTLLEVENYNLNALTTTGNSYTVEEANGTIPAFSIAKPTAAAGYTMPLTYTIVDANGNTVNVPVTENGGKLSFTISQPGTYTFKASAPGTVAYNPGEVTASLSVFANPGLKFNDASASAEIDAQSKVTFEVLAAKFTNAACKNEITYKVYNAAGNEVPCSVSVANDLAKVSFSATTGYYTLKASSARANCFLASEASMQLDAKATNTAVAPIADNEQAQWFDIYGKPVDINNANSGIYIRVAYGKAEKVIR